MMHTALATAAWLLAFTAVAVYMIHDWQQTRAAAIDAAKDRHPAGGLR